MLSSFRSSGAMSRRIPKLGYARGLLGGVLALSPELPDANSRSLFVYPRVNTRA
mgnify:CR=1